MSWIKFYSIGQLLKMSLYLFCAHFQLTENIAIQQNQKPLAYQYHIRWILANEFRVFPSWPPCDLQFGANSKMWLHFDVFVLRFVLCVIFVVDAYRTANTRSWWPVCACVCVLVRIRAIRIASMDLLNTNTSTHWRPYAIHWFSLFFHSITLTIGFDSQLLNKTNNEAQMFSCTCLWSLE